MEEWAIPTELIPADGLAHLVVMRFEKGQPNTVTIDVMEGECRWCGEKVIGIRHIQIGGDYYFICPRCQQREFEMSLL